MSSRVGTRMGTKNEMQPDDYQRRVRRNARIVSWGLAPLFVVVIALWLLFNTVVCGSGRATPLEVLICRHAHFLPDFSVALVLLSFVWLLVALHAFGKKQLKDKPTGHVGTIRRHAGYVRHGYRDLKDPQQSIAFHALEMSAWTAALAICILIFYWFELAFPLGLLVIAGISRIAYRVVRRFLGPPPGPARNAGGDNRTPPSGPHRALAYEDQHLGWNILRVPQSLPGTTTPHPGRTCAIFVVHGIGDQLSTATAAQLRSGFEDALVEIKKWQIEHEYRDTTGPEILLPSPIICEGFWGNYEDIAATFPDEWFRFNDSDRQFFSSLWRQRVFSTGRTIRWFIGQQLRLLSPRVLFEVGPLAWILYIPLQLVSLVTLAVAFVWRRQIITDFLTDVRLYLDPRGDLERAIVQKIDERVGREFLRMIGLDWNFRPLPDWERLQFAGEVLTFHRVIWVAHSLGTVISYNVLSALFHRARNIEQEGDQEQRHGVECFRSRLARFVTMGSPLDKVAFLFKEKSPLRPWPRESREALLLKGERIQEAGKPEEWEWWINFYHVLDPISGALQNPDICGADPPSNYHIRSGILPGLAHVAYWTDRTALRFILGRTYGAEFLRDREIRPWQPSFLALLAILGYLVWAGLLFLAVWALYHYWPIIARALANALLP